LGGNGGVSGEEGVDCIVDGGNGRGVWNGEGFRVGTENRFRNNSRP